MRIVVGKTVNVVVMEMGIKMSRQIIISRAKLIRSALNDIKTILSSIDEYWDDPSDFKRIQDLEPITILEEIVKINENWLDLDLFAFSELCVEVLEIITEGK